MSNTTMADTSQRSESEQPEHAASRRNPGNPRVWSERILESASAIPTPGCAMCLSPHKAHAAQACPALDGRVEFVDLVRNVTHALRLDGVQLPIAKFKTLLAKLGVDDGALCYLQRHRFHGAARLTFIDRATQKHVCLRPGATVLIVQPFSLAGAAACAAAGAAEEHPIANPQPGAAFEPPATPISAATSFPVYVPPPINMAGRNWASFVTTPAASLLGFTGSSHMPQPTYFFGSCAAPEACNEPPAATAGNDATSVARTVRITISHASASLTPPPPLPELTRAAFRAALDSFGVVLRVRVPEVGPRSFVAFVEFMTAEAALAMIATNSFPLAVGASPDEVLQLHAGPAVRAMQAPFAAHDGKLPVNGRGWSTASTFGLGDDARWSVSDAAEHAGLVLQLPDPDLQELASSEIADQRHTATAVQSAMDTAVAWFHDENRGAEMAISVLAGLADAASLASAALASGGTLPPSETSVTTSRPPAKELSAVLRAWRKALFLAGPMCSDHRTAAQLVASAFDHCLAGVLQSAFTAARAVASKAAFQLCHALAIAANLSRRTIGLDREPSSLVAALRCQYRNTPLPKPHTAVTAHMLNVALAIGAACEGLCAADAVAVLDAVKVAFRASQQTLRSRRPIAVAASPSVVLGRPSSVLVMELLQFGIDAVPRVFVERSATCENRAYVPPAPMVHGDSDTESTGAVG